jgi:hypothetical protein
MLQAKLDGNFSVDGWFNITLKDRNKCSEHKKQVLSHSAYSAIDSNHCPKPIIIFVALHTMFLFSFQWHPVRLPTCELDTNPRRCCFGMQEVIILFVYFILLLRSLY